MDNVCGHASRLDWYIYTKQLVERISTYKDYVTSMFYKTTLENVIRYWSILCALMSLKDGVIYERNRIFTNEHLLTLTPNDDVEFFCLKVYGSSHPDVDAIPKFGRSILLESYKEHKSYFIPNCLICWDV